MPMAWCELADAMRERGLAWDGKRAWDPEGRFVAVDAGLAGEEPPRTVDQALRLLPPWRPEDADRPPAAGRGA
jgi:hypothetical protein